MTFSITPRTCCGDANPAELPAKQSTKFEAEKVTSTFYQLTEGRQVIISGHATICSGGSRGIDLPRVEPRQRSQADLLPRLRLCGIHKIVGFGP
jgi:hypothetical protein